MRLKRLVWCSIAACALATSGAYAQPLGMHLSRAEAEGLEEPLYRKQSLLVSGQDFLVVTREYGSGLRLQEAYVYLRNSSELWDLVAFRRTNSAEVTARVNGDRLELRTKAGQLALIIPLASLVASSDPREQ